MDLDNTSYEFRLFTRADNASHFIVTYTNGTTLLTSNATSSSQRDISGNSTITSAGSNPTLRNAIHIAVAKSLLGTIEIWNIDGTATQRGTTYSYRDFGWALPGNPGSAPPPTPPQNPSILPSWIWLVMLPVVAVIIALILVVGRRKKKPVPPPQP